MLPQGSSSASASSSSSTAITRLLSKLPRCFLQLRSMTITADPSVLLCARQKCDAVEKDECNNGCSGGLMTNAYNYLMQSGGLEEEKSYPYTGKQGECKFDKNKIAVSVTNFTVIPLDEEQIIANLVHRGPLAGHFLE